MNDAGRTSHRPARSVRVAAGAGLAALLLGSGAGVSAMVGSADDTARCTDSADVKVEVAPELYDVVYDRAQELQRNPAVCANYDVSRKSASDVSRELKAGGADLPDVWIPDSSVWVSDVSNKLGPGWVNDSGSIATSPVVLGVPQALKDRPAFRSTPNWKTVLSDAEEPVSVQDSTVSSTALVTASAANREATSRAERTNLLRSIIRLSRSTMPLQTISDRATKGSDLARAFPISEQQLIGYDKTNPGKKLVPIVPGDGAAELDYPFVQPVKGSSAPKNAVKALLAALRTPETAADLSAAGFRVTPGVQPAGSSVPSDVKMVRPLTDKEQVSSVKSWTDLSEDARMLVLVDVSGSMILPVEGGGTRVSLLMETAKLALNALPGTTEMSAWAFSTNLDGTKDYLPLVPDPKEIGDTKIGRAHKAELRKQLDTMPDLVAKNGDTGLYDSIWAAYQSATKNYGDGYVNSVVVLTDGKNDDPGGGLSLEQLLSRLGKTYDSDKPVKIVAIAMGDDTDPAALKRIARATDGLSYTTTDPSQIATVFIDAFLHRS